MDPDRNATEAGNDEMTQGWMRCWFCQAVRPLFTGRPVSSLVSKPWFGAIGSGPCPGASDTPSLGCGHRQMRRDATPCAEFGVRASTRKAIPRRIEESRCFGSLQSELRPNQIGPVWRVKWANPGLSASTGRGVRPGVGRVHGCRFMRPVGRESLPHVNTVESFRNEVVIGAKHGAGFCRNPCV